jgi:hypothetical protein
MDVQQMIDQNMGWMRARLLELAALSPDAPAERTSRYAAVSQAILDAIERNEDPATEHAQTVVRQCLATMDAVMGAEALRRLADPIFLQAMLNNLGIHEFVARVLQSRPAGSCW